MVRILVVLMIVSNSVLAAVSVLPRPESLQVEKGSFTITAGTLIVHEEGSESARRAAEYLASALRPATGYPCDIKAAAGAPAGAIALLVQDAADDLGAEGYTLDASPDTIVIMARTEKGLFYGIQTLRQLLPAEIMGGQVAEGVKWTIPAVTIKDRPRFTWRGTLLDVGRHFFPVDDVKKHIDLLALYKMNVLHLHLTEDQGWRIEIKKYPRLTEVGSLRAESPRRGNRTEGDGTPYGPFFYTQEEIGELVAYAAARHVTIVPEIELPGHSRAALAAYPELGCTGGPYEVRTRWGVEADIYCAGREEVFAFLEDVLTEVLDLFPSEFIHIGGDEAPKKRWDACPRCRARIEAEGLHDSHELQSYFIRRVEKFLNSKGRRLIGWDEILEGGLAPNASVMSWRGTKGGIAAAQAGHDVVMSPTSHCYFDYYQGRDRAREPEAIGGYLPLKKVYAYEPVPDPEQLDPSRATHILGAQGNIWTEYIHDYAQVQYMAVPRMIALSEVVWSPREGKDYGDFVARLKAHLAHLDEAEVHYRALDPEPAVVGSWKSGEPTETWAVREWEIGRHVTGAGKIKVTFLYTGGGCRLDVRSVEIVVDGRIVAKDAHWGTTGARHEKNTYSLEIGEFPAGATITLRAQIRSDGGTDSNGEILLSKEG